VALIDDVYRCPDLGAMTVRFGDRSKAAAEKEAFHETVARDSSPIEEAVVQNYRSWE
jgi:hypothetical protein